MSSGRKRKGHASSSGHSRPDPEPSILNLSIQGYEADIIRGAEAMTAAKSLEYTLNSTDKVVHIGSALIQLQPTRQLPSGFSSHHIDDAIEPVDDIDAVWVDRYDVRLLLDPSDVPPPNRIKYSSAIATSSIGWDDLPPDSEGAEMTTEQQRKKRRRDNELDHEKRLQAIRAADEQEGIEVWGGSDEEPDEEQKIIMRRTAEKFADATNPAQLEMRIMANHGAEKQFSFLRGRWARAWAIAKGLARLKKQREEEKAAHKTGLGTLADYGDSSDDGEGQENDAASVGEIREPVLDKEAEALKEARRLRAKEWSEKRRQIKDAET